MYKSFVFYQDPYNSNLCSVRVLKSRFFRNPNTAIKAIIDSGLEGYVKKVGHKTPIWNNVK